ncbi:MAG TPA: class I SAM-dependent methyltransferase, partial [Candidatus Dormibacteraeota bacterium]
MKSYDAAREHADLQSEIERLGAQLELSWSKELRALKAFGLRDGMTVVDLGCGPGQMLAKLSTAFPRSHLTGVELDARLCAEAADRLERRSELVVVNRSALDTGLGAASVDFAVARFLFQHLHDPVQAAREALRILKPGGSLVVIDVDQSIWGLADPP